MSDEQRLGWGEERPLSSAPFESLFRVLRFVVDGLESRASADWADWYVLCSIPMISKKQMLQISRNQSIFLKFSIGNCRLSCFGSCSLLVDHNRWSCLTVCWQSMIWRETKEERRASSWHSIQTNRRWK